MHAVTCKDLQFTAMMPPVDEGSVHPGADPSTSSIAVGLLFDFFYNSSISAQFWQYPASIDDGEEQNKKFTLMGIEPRIS